MSQTAPQARAILSVVVVLALLHGSLYALILPAWDYNDEEQHFDYVQRLAEEGRLPTMGTYLSHNVLASASETGRWERLRLSRPPAIDVRVAGLEGFSYEAYQPPLYYILLTAPFKLFSAIEDGFEEVQGEGATGTDTLVMLYLLRFFTVALAAITAGIAYRFLQMVLRDTTQLAGLGALILLFIPERTMTASRVNNDALLELFAALSTVALLSYARYPSWRKALVLGTLLGLGLLTKLSAIALIPPIVAAIAWRASTDRGVTRFIRDLFLVFAPAILLSGWYFLRNILLYADVTGAAAFLQLAGFTARHTTSSMLFELGQRLWMTRWQGVGPQALGSFMAVVGLVSLVGLLKILSSNGKPSCNGNEGYNGNEDGLARCQVVLLSLSVASWLLPLWWGTRIGLVQHIDGRFVVGAYVPIVALVLVGLQRLLSDRTLWLALLGMLAVFVLADAAYIFLFSLPFYYPRELSDAYLVFASNSALADRGIVLIVALCYTLVALALFWMGRQRLKPS